MKPRRRLVPSIALGVLTLGAGLGVGLGLSEGPLTYSPAGSLSQTFLGSVGWSCTISDTQGVKTVNCATKGEAFAVYLHKSDALPKGLAACMTKGLDTVAAPSGDYEVLFRAVRSRCGLPPVEGIGGEVNHASAMNRCHGANTKAFGQIVPKTLVLVDLGDFFPMVVIYESAM